MHHCVIKRSPSTLQNTPPEPETVSRRQICAVGGYEISQRCTVHYAALYTITLTLLGVGPADRSRSQEKSSDDSNSVSLCSSGPSPQPRQRQRPLIIFTCTACSQQKHQELCSNMRSHGEHHDRSIILQVKWSLVFLTPDRGNLILTIVTSHLLQLAILTL